MATADELLATLTNSEEETVLTINNDLRTITIPKSITALGVEADDDVHRLYFRMPRMCGDTDLSTFNIRINYLNARNEGDIYVVTDKKILTSSITFSWLVGPNALAAKGNIKFIVCLKDSDADGNILREFNTTIATLPVLEGLEVDAYPLEGELQDVLEQLQSLTEAKVSEIATAGSEQVTKVQQESTNQQDNIVEKGREVLATIPEDYQTTYNLATEAARTKADAIICSVEGTTIRVSDAASDPLRGLGLFGKTTQVTTTGTQLFNPYAEQNTSFGIATVENNGARITVTGTYYVSWPLVLKAGTTYYINFGTVGTATNRAIRFEYPDKEITGTITNPASFTPTEDTVSVYLYAGLGTEGTIIYENVQISEGSSAIPWEPYSGSVVSPSPEWPQSLVNIEKPTVDIYGKNLAVQNHALDYTAKGVNISTLENASEVLLNGTAESLFSHTVLRTRTLSPGTYTVSTIGVNKHDDGHDRLYIADYYTGKVYANYLRDGSPKTITLSEHTRLRIDMVFKEGSVYNNATLKIQIEAGTAATEYEQCKVVQSVSADYTTSGIPVESDGNYTDSNGQQWICDEIDFERGVYVQRIGTTVFDGSTDEIWYDELILDNSVMFRIQISDSVNVGNVVGKDYLCSNFAVKNMYNSDVQGTQHTMQQFYFRVNKTVLSTADMDGFRAYLEGSPMTVNYVLKTPVETSLTAEEIESFKTLYSIYPNTTIMNSATAWMAVKYNADTEIWIDNRITERLPLKSTTITLYKDKWVENGLKYSQVVTINGTTANSKIDLQPSPDQLADFVAGGVSLTTTNDNGVVTVYAIGATPEGDCSMQVLITEVVQV